MALPWLESGHLLAKEAVSGKATAAPHRFAALFMSNGALPRDWWARGDGDAMKLGPSLKPLEPFKKDLCFIRGLYNPESLNGEQHMASTGNILSGEPIKRTLSNPEAGTSVDQLLARRIGRDTAIPSLVLGSEAMNFGNFRDAYTMIYSSCISWADPRTPMAKEIFPRLAFDRLFGDPANSRHDRSVLDCVRDDARRIASKVSGADRQRIQQYFDSVREIELRLERRSADTATQSLPIDPTAHRPAEGFPESTPQQMELMLDLIVLAFQCDRTRVATYMFNNDISTMSFNFLGHPEQLHNISHHGNKPDNLDRYAKTNRFHVEKLAYLVKRLSEIKEGDKTLLDRTSLMLLSSFMDGNAHDRSENPMILVGGGGKAYPLGRSYDFTGKPNRELSRLYLRILQAHDPKVRKMGDYGNALKLG